MTKTGICNWPKNRLYWGRGFKRPAALPGGGGFSLVNKVM